MDNKDFFDEEYDKIENKHDEEKSQNFDDWYGRQPAPSKSKNGNKPLYITLICLALVACIVLGWVLCTVFTSISRSTKGQSALFDDVLQYLENQYYKEIPDEKMWAAMEQAGTAMMQNAGDQFSRLMSPSTYYELVNPTSSKDTNENGSFGVEFQFIEGIGMYVYEVTTDSSAYGKLQGEDIIYKISDIKTIDNQPMENIVTSAVKRDDFIDNLDNIKSATFYALRNGEAVEPVIISRGITDYVNPDYKFEFIEFYFGDKCTNVSTSNIGTAGTNTKEARKLGELNKFDDVGYIRIKEFSYILIPSATENGKEEIHSVLDEFIIAMNLFKSEIRDKNGNIVKKPCKRLILDLKGNPGGSVQYVAEIAGMLSTDSKLSDSERKAVKSGDKSIITTLIKRNGSKQIYPATLSYETYFGELTDKQSIVVWTDGGSASASELLTGALRDYGTAVQMGTTTYGKGIAQTWEELTNYKAVIQVDGKSVTSCWAIYYTVAEYFSPVTGTNIHGMGYTPDGSFNGLDTYDKLWTATIGYFNNSASGGTVASK